MDRTRNILAIVRSQLWLVPALFMMAAVGLAFILLRYGNDLVPTPDREQWWIYSGEASTARNLLSSLLAGLMTMTSLVVSVTFVILTLAANQLGPRLISIFMGDRQIQSVLGLFIGTILYVILIMRILDDTIGSDGVPHLAVTAASVLTILCLLALLFYIHKIARSIIADNVVEAVAQEFRETLRSILSDVDKHGREAPERPAAASEPGHPISLCSVGYLQVVDYGKLRRLGCKHDILLEVRVRAGHYVLQNGDHVIVRPPRAATEELGEEIREAFTVGSMRTPAQDPEHGIRQLVEIGTRALSPGTNDPFTAKAVIDRLGSAFEEALSQRLQARLIKDEDGNVRVIADRVDIGGLLDTAFHPLRQAGSDHPAILIRIADTIRHLAPSVRTAEQRTALFDQLERLEETAELGKSTPRDKQDIAERLRAARDALASGSWPS
jgi:uncharacterized membrane protein